MKNGKKISNFSIRNVSILWKLLTTALVGVVIFFVVSRFASAESVSVTIVGDNLSDGKWEVGSDNVTWTASAYNSDNDEYMSLEDGGSIVWESSDRNIVDIAQSSEGTESTAVLKPLSAGKVTISATFTKVVSTDDGDYEITSKAQRTVIVKFHIDDSSIPTAPYEDDWTIPNIITNSSNPVTWVSSDESVVTVSDDGSGNGILNIVGAGKATVKATTSDGQSDSFRVVVNAKFIESTSMINVGYNEYYTLSTNARHASNINFESANPKVASVDGDGTIKGVSAGMTYMYVYTLDSKDEWYSLQPSPVRSIPVMVDFDIITSSKSIAVGDTVELLTNMLDSNKKSINWTSSDTSVATVSSDGVVEAISKGTVTITASVVNNEVFGTTDIQKSSVTINIIDSFGLSETEHILNVGESFDLSAIVTDSSATVTWKSSDTSIAKITTNKNDKYTVSVEAKSKGSATITAVQIVDGVEKTATCEVNVKEPVLNVAISPSEVEIVKGAQYRLIVTFSPSKPDNTNVKWVSSDETVVKVDDSGIITGVKGGQAAVSVVSEDGIKVASCTVSVREPVTSIKMDVHTVTTSLATGTYQLTYTILPTGDGVNRDVTWTSSAPDVATVGENGLVTFKKPGKATIIVKTVDTGTNGNLIDTCEFYINNPVQAVDLDYTSITLKLDEKFRLTTKVTPDDATNKTILWSSSDTNVVTVNDEGMVVAVGSGSATILAKSEDSGATSMCNVTVYQPVTSLTISNETMTVRKGTEFWLNAKALPENAMNKEISWSSNDTSVATVDSNGKVTTLEAGSCVITATSQDSGVTARCTLTVLQPITGIYLNTSSKTIMKGEKFVIIPTITPSDADNKNVTYTSSDDSIAKVDSSGIVTGMKGGQAIIIAKTEERGLIASCQVTVQEFVSDVSVSSKVSKVNIGETSQLTATVTTETATNRTISWSSSNNSVLTVDQNGKIKGIRVGKATVYARATDGSGMSGSVSIEVINPVTSISVSPTSVSIPEGRSTKVSATVSPSNATYRDVEWSSSDTSIATVDYDGEITGLKAGVCKVYATSSDGNEVVGICKVTVTPIVAATGITINSKSITMLAGQTRTLTARIKPTKSTESIKWVSGDTSVATVSSSGVVTSRGQGSTEIYAISSETGVESSCEVIVLALNATYITLEQYDSYDLDVFGSTETIKWYSNNKRVATVTSGGMVVARMAGTTTITAKVNGKVLYCTVKVTTMK
jgi:uncharacterized protein YjdB